MGQKLADFVVESLGVQYPDYFQGYGTAFTSYNNSTYGIGYTEAEALDDCIDTMADMCGFAFSEDDEKRIRAAFGVCDADTTVADDLGLDEDDDCDVDAYFHVGIKWNEEG
jgi:hypothetical protein